MRQDGQYLAEIESLLGFSPRLLQVGKHRYKSCHGCALETIAHRDVKGAKIGRDGIEHGQKQFLVGQHDSCAKRIETGKGRMPLLQNLTCQLGLPHPRRDGIEIHLTFFFRNESMLKFLIQYLIAKIRQIVLGEIGSGCSLGAFRPQTRIRIIPAELCPSVKLENLHQPTIDLAHGS